MSSKNGSVRRIAIRIFRMLGDMKTSIVGQARALICVRAARVPLALALAARRTRETFAGLDADLVGRFAIYLRLGSVLLDMADMRCTSAGEANGSSYQYWPGRVC